MPSNTSVGFFGKLPSNGDFIQRRMAQGFLDIWDPWLQECVHASRQALQETWLSTYLTSPVWRFVLTDAACGSGAYAGILVPSVDRVGRYFPMTVVTQVEVDSNPLLLATRYSPWFDALESVVVGALETPDVDLEGFDAQVMNTARLLEGEFNAVEHGLRELFGLSRFPAQTEYWRAPLATAGSLQDAINAFAFAQISAQLRPMSLWWTEGSGASPPSWLSLRGLPPPDRFAALLNGEWSQHGWNNLGELPGERASAKQPLAPESPADAVASDAIPLGVPRATHPEAQLSAIETNRAAFVIRPEIGLWAVAATEPNADATGVRILADALQQLAPAASLSALVELVRLTLADVHGNLSRLATRDVLRLDAQVSSVVMVAMGAECAFLSAGSVQKFLVRARTMLRVDDAEIEEGPSVQAGSLMELLTDSADSYALGANRFRSLRVHYERLRREDQWILCARPVIGAHDLARLTATAASGMPISAETVLETLAHGGVHAVMPILTVEV